MRRTRPALVLLIALLAACGGRDEVGSSRTATPAAAGSAGAAQAPAPARGETGNEIELAAADGSERSSAARAPGERPLPGFEGRTLAGTHFSISTLIGKRMLLFFFNPELKESEPVAKAVAAVATQSRRHNFNVVGIGVGSTASKLRAFATRMDLDFPVLDDTDARISTIFRLPGGLLIIGADAEGYLTFVHPGFDTSSPETVATITDTLRESLRIPLEHDAAGGRLADHPTAPLFETQDIDGKAFSLAEFEGRPKIVIFFLHTCSHCHAALEFFKQQLAKIPEPKRPALVAISLQNRPSEVRIALREHGLDFFRVLVDPDQKIGKLYGLKGGVPDISMVSSEGRIVHRIQGWREDRDPDLMRMYLARIAGEQVPFMLSRNGYSGNDACVVCHDVEAATWDITPHARAYDTLVTHGQERDAECVSCHVVGFQKTGGFAFGVPMPQLENVGCENCHGRGGPHLSPDFAKMQPQAYATVCQSCHDKKHSLGFEFASFLPRISHKSIAAMSLEQRAASFGAQGPKHALLPTTASHVGSEACRSCHESEFLTWGKSPHAHALASLESQSKAGDGACQRCHTTGYGDEGGFPEFGDVRELGDLARVGCESCHGPGGDHVGENAKRFGTILSLGDKCDSCVILQICGSCHDAANDPDFEFEVQEHIDRQRHGTIEAGTGKPLGESALRSEHATDLATIAEALRRLSGES